MRPVLVLRPEPGASATVERARKRRLSATAIPLFEIESLAWEPPDAGGFDGLLLTSANAVRRGGDQLESLRALPAYAVGEATAGAAREAGFSIAATGNADVDRFLASIDPELRLLHLCGADRRSPEHPSQSITPIIVYRANPVEAPDLSSAKGAVALIHSPRAGRRFAELVRDRISTSIVAISSAAAEAVGRGWQAVEVADQPTDDALLAVAARLCNNPPPE
jgi:uroporphyrinogen-III synthase